MLRFTGTFLGIAFAVSGLANNGLQSFKVIFPTGVTKLTRSVMKQASDIYNKLPERNFTRIKLIGESEENQAKVLSVQLAKKRAYSVREFFIGIGCTEKNVKLDMTGMPVVILFKPKARYSISGKINLDKIEQQCFNIDPSQKTFFKTKGGNIFVFQPNSFETEYGMPVAKNINICVWEFYKKTDMIACQLSSCGENQVLETASTFYIQVFKGDEKVQLKKNKNYKIYLNRDSDVNGFKAYYGQVKDGNVFWVEDKKSYAYISMFDEGDLKNKIDKKSNSFVVRPNQDKDENKLDKKLLLKGKKIGWINCDRVIHVDKPSDLEVVLENVSDEFSVRLVLSKKNAIIPGMVNSNSINHYKFSKVPSGESGYVLAYKESGSGYSLAYSQVTIGFIKSINLKPEYKTKEEFEKLIDSFLN
ncbi:MAG: hypothetical protein CMD35_00360 [Flavobacteriales bacterium]|nr:hypothetical protein [Flavobacteriales bacterium]|tara:strand:+ start:75596 stop:76846 length:1251 start_codon:yes stop_codon:yes gene_type:complete